MVLHLACETRTAIILSATINNDWTQHFLLEFHKLNTVPLSGWDREKGCLRLCAICECTYVCSPCHDVIKLSSVRCYVLPLSVAMGYQVLHLFMLLWLTFMLGESGEMNGLWETHYHYFIHQEQSHGGSCHWECHLCKTVFRLLFSTPSLILMCVKKKMRKTPLILTVK